MTLPEEPSARAGSGLLLGIGVLAVALGLGADLVGIDEPGFGTPQTIAVVAGTLLIGVAIAIDARRRARIAETWRAAATASPLDHVALAVGFGLLTGTIEVVQQLIRMGVSERILPLPDSFIWLFPAFYAAVFLPLGLLMAVPLRPWRNTFRLPAAAFVLSFLAMWSQLVLHPEIDDIAVLVLAAGIGLQVGRLAYHRAPGFVRAARVTGLILGGLVGATAALMPIVTGVAERSAREARAAPPASAPNVLFIVLDTVRADHLGLHGYERATSPRIDALATSGVAFENAISTGPWTVPAHATLFTGQYPLAFEPKLRMESLGEKFPTIAETFRGHGYATGGFVGNVLYTGRARGFGRGFERYMDFRVSVGVAALSTALGRRLLSSSPHKPQIRNDAATVADGFLDWQATVDSRPFFAFLNFFDAHALYLPPAPFDSVFGPPSPNVHEWRSKRQEWTDEEMDGWVRAYDGCIAYIDQQIDRLLETLDERGVLHNTLVVVTADHGEHFGEHGLLSHANSLYPPLLHVPMVFSMPSTLTEPQRIKKTVSLRDLPATLLDFAGIAKPDGIGGQSLVPLWHGGKVATSPAMASIYRSPGLPLWWPAAWGNMRSLTVGAYHIIESGQGEDLLFDHRKDPDEQNNLIEKRPNLARKLKRTMKKVNRGEFP